MSALTIASDRSYRGTREPILGLTSFRDAWLDMGLRAKPADRTTAETAVTELYRRVGFRAPEFVWVPSPPAGADFLVAEDLSAPMSLEGSWTDCPSVGIASDIAAMRTRLDAQIARRGSDWPNRRDAAEKARRLTPEESFAAGIGRGPIIRAALWDSLRTSLFDGVAAAVRTLLPPFVGGVPWYGQQEAHRVAFYDFYRRTGLLRVSAADGDLLDVLGALVGATGWWWAVDDVCVMTERPAALHSEPTPDGAHDQRRLHHSEAPALEYPDGAGVFVQHGTIVPDWVVLDPTVERIAQERNVEIRRSAIERIGWDSYIEAAALKLVDHADDPGNPGCVLQLFATPDEWGNGERILLATNGSYERDGHRRRYGLSVPHWIPTAIDAAGWTYGIAGADYARLVRRT